MALRACLEPGCPMLTSRTRCALHERLRQRRRGTPTQRGYDAAYQRARRALLSVAERCAWCGQPPRPRDPLTADHVVPLAQGGGTDGNLVAAHRSCNSARTATVRRGGGRRVA